MSLLYHNDTIIKKEKELLRALLIQFCKPEFITLIFAKTILLKLQFSQTKYTFLHSRYISHGLRLHNHPCKHP